MANAPDPAVLFSVMDMVMGKWRSQAISVAAELGVADVLADGAKPVGEIARKVGAHANNLYRLLRGLTVLGLFHEEEGRRFSLTDSGQLLRSGVPGSVRDWARYIGHEVSWKAWGELIEGVRTGEPVFERVFGMEAFAYLSKHPEAAEIFDGAMTTVSAMDSAAIAAAYDFSGFKTVMDVAGGYGLLLATVLEANPKLRGILFEMPHVLEGAKKLLSARGVLDRCELIGGSFFEKVRPGADAYMMKHIIHDWDDERSEKILRTCHTAMSSEAKLLVLDAVIPGPNEPHMGKLLDLEMIAMTPQGRERTEAEFATLFKRSGFRLTRVVPTVAPSAVVEGVKA